MEHNITKLDLVLEQYNEDIYPELAGQDRTPHFDVVAYAPAVLGIDEKTLRIIYSFTKVVELYRVLYHVTQEQAEGVVKNCFISISENKYKPIWSMLTGSFDEVFQETNDKYEVLRDKQRCPDGLDDACIGFDAESLRMIYSQSKAIQILLSRDSMTWVEAQGFLEVNTFPYSDPKQYQPIWCDDEMLQNFNEEVSVNSESVYLAVFNDERDGIGMEKRFNDATAWKTLDAIYEYYEVPAIYRKSEDEIRNNQEIAWKFGDFEPFKVLTIKSIPLND